VKLVIGLGNPGEEYVGTRHNVGFDVVDIVARRCGASLTHDRRLTARVGRGEVGGTEALLVEPLAYMNLSGPVVARIVRERELALSDLLVVVDDFHLPVAQLRVREKGSAGGHNGLKSLIASLATDVFARLRVGIGEAPEGDAVDFVLTRFKPAERKAMDEGRELAANCVEDWCRLGTAAAMNRYNVKKGREPEGEV
jgi:peptidyl-tRNA hydrolase, PTH1 family